MSNKRFELDTVAFRKEVLQSASMLTFITSEARNYANGGEFVRPFIGFDRAKAFIYPVKERKKK